MWGGFIKDKRGIEGLPMRLIIIVVVAAVVLAAILAMMPKSTPSSLKVSCWKIDGDSNGHTKDSTGSVVLVKANGEEEVKGIHFIAHVNVTDANGKPISGATVIISGGGAAGVGPTHEDGAATVDVKGAKLGENQDEAYLKVTVKASGYPDYVNNHGLLLQRVTD